VGEEDDDAERGAVQDDATRELVHESRAVS
jgi:hypothetical protein